jgi:hypothetical protein
MLSSWIFWYSDVNGALLCWAKSLVRIELHALTSQAGDRVPLAFPIGVFHSASAPPIVAVSAAASASARSSFGFDMTSPFLPALPQSRRTRRSRSSPPHFTRSHEEREEKTPLHVDDRLKYLKSGGDWSSCAIHVTRDEHEFVPVVCSLTRKGCADACRRTGHDEFQSG